MENTSEQLIYEAPGGVHPLLFLFVTWLFVLLGMVGKDNSHLKRR